MGCLIPFGIKNSCSQISKFILFHSLLLNQMPPNRYHLIFCGQNCGKLKIYNGQLGVPWIFFLKLWKTKTSVRFFFFLMVFLMIYKCFGNFIFTCLAIEKIMGSLFCWKKIFSTVCVVEFFFNYKLNILGHKLWENISFILLKSFLGKIGRDCTFSFFFLKS